MDGAEESKCRDNAATLLTVLDRFGNVVAVVAACAWVDFGDWVR